MVLERTSVPSVLVATAHAMKAVWKFISLHLGTHEDHSHKLETIE